MNSTLHAYTNEFRTLPRLMRDCLQAFEFTWVRVGCDSQSTDFKFLGDSQESGIWRNLLSICNSHLSELKRNNRNASISHDIRTLNYFENSGAEFALDAQMLILISESFRSTGHLARAQCDHPQELRIGIKVRCKEQVSDATFPNALHVQRKFEP